jgi:hypothetical protein
MRRYAPDAASVAPLIRLDAEPDGLQPDANRSAFAPSRRLRAVAFAAVIAFSMLVLLANLAKSADVRTHLRGAALRSGWPGTGARVGLNAVPTSFGSERFYELRHYGVLRSSRPRDSHLAYNLACLGIEKNGQMAYR